MRVIAGKMRGMNLNSPKDRRVRPTTDRIKEDLFNIIMPYVIDARVLDLFAGSGAIGIEAISRGSEFVTFVDKSKASIDLIKQNVNKTKCFDECEIIKTDALSFLDTCESKYDIIYLDPPYKYDKIKLIIEKIDKCGILKKEGVLIVEHDRKISFDEKISRFKMYKSKTYSLSMLSFYNLEE